RHPGSAPDVQPAPADPRLLAEAHDRGVRAHADAHALLLRVARGHPRVLQRSRGVDAAPDRGVVGREEGFQGEAVPVVLLAGQGPTGPTATRATASGGKRMSRGYFRIGSGGKGKGCGKPAKPAGRARPKASPPRTPPEACLLDQDRVAVLRFEVENGFHFQKPP